eukprot:2354204-Alexandrium_andersonii.AAC.1
MFGVRNVHRPMHRWVRVGFGWSMRLRCLCSNDQYACRQSVRSATGANDFLAQAFDMHSIGSA